MTMRDLTFLNLLNNVERQRELTPKNNDPEEFFGGLLDNCEKKIPCGYEDIEEFIRDRAKETGIPFQALAESVSRRNHGALNKDGNEFDIVLDLVRQRTEFERTIIRENLDGMALSSIEYILFDTGLELMSVIDFLFFRWKEAVPDVLKRTAQELKMERSEVAQFLIDRKLNDRYAVVVDAATDLPPVIYENDGDYREIAYADFFKVESSEIRRILMNGVKSLKKLPNVDETGSWIAYFEAWAAAAVNGNAELHEILWKKVDEAWVACSGRVIIVHPMEEGYADPIRIMPEVRVLLQLNDAKDMIATIKQRMLDWEEELYGNHPRYPQFRTALENTHAGVFITPLYSGEDFDFRFSGQIVPNRSEVRIKGTKIFLDRNSCRNKIDIYGATVNKYFTEEFVSNFHERVSPETFLYYVIAHECGHSVLIGSDTREKMGDNYRNVEEFKASHIGMEVLMTMENRLPPGYLDSLSLFIVARIIRFMTKGMRGDKTLEPYYKESLIQLNVLLDWNFLQFENGKLSFNMENRAAFFTSILRINDELKRLYLDEDWASVRKFRLKYTVVDDRVQEIFDYLDKE
ncbi:MAG: hypothetical protein QF682_10050 [Candidatus Thermoplasmatota archaeon]|nr:hypothetical protein [Candidatus Thermoplasmatota archaeon]